jgi:hypothetical protein
MSDAIPLEDPPFDDVEGAARLWIRYLEHYEGKVPPGIAHSFLQGVKDALAVVERAKALLSEPEFARAKALVRSRG